MRDNKHQKWVKRHKIIVGIIVLAIVVGAAKSVVLLMSSKHSTTSKQSEATSAGTANTATASLYKLAACTSGATQTIANASYLVGTDISAGSYKIVSQPAGTDWTNINIYNSKAEYVKQGSPSVEQGNPDTSLSPQNNVPTYTKLSNGQFMQVDADPATFTCE